mgnify:FL=1
MKDMLSVILRIILGIVAIFVIIMVFAFKYETGEDKGKIRKDQERIVEYIKEKVELENKEEIKKIEFKKHKKRTSTGTWRFYVVINDRVTLIFVAWGLNGEIELDSYGGGDINILENKGKNSRYDIEVIYEK